MSYLKQTWSDYDKNKSEELNKQNGAVLNSDRMNHIENGISEVDTKTKTLEESAIKIDDTTTTKTDTVYSSFKVNAELEKKANKEDIVKVVLPEWIGDTKPVYTAEEVGALPDDTVIPTIPSWVGETKPVYTAEEVGALSKDTTLLSIDDTTAAVDKVYSSKKVDTELEKKANVSDIPELPAWVGENKPVYTATEVGALPKDTPLLAIDDSATSTTKVYSSEKISTELGKKANVSDVPTIPSWVGENKPVYTATEVGALPDNTVIPTVDDSKTEANIWSALKVSTELGKKADKDHLLPKVWYTVSDTGSNPASDGIPGGFIINPENGMFQKLELTKNSYLYKFDGGENKTCSLPVLNADHPLMFLQVNGSSDDGIIYDSFDLWIGLNAFKTRKDGLPLMFIFYFDGEGTSIAISATSEYALDEMHAGGTTDDRPFTLKPYQTYFDTTLNKLIVWTGTAWVDTNGVEV